MKDTLVVNLFGAPGAGKSTGAAYVFSRLKMMGINTELVTEFAKDKVWENSTEVLNNQPYVFGEQSLRISRCCDKVDVVITDSPLLLSILYNEEKRISDSLNRFVFDVFKLYNNKNYLIYRTKDFNPIGRLQNKDESDVIHNNIKDLLSNNNIVYECVDGTINGYEKIINDVLNIVRS